MPSSFFGKTILRREDDRLLSGAGRYVDDITLPDMLHVAFHRSPHAHARIRRVDVSRARAMDGVVDVVSHDDLGPAGQPFPQLLPHRGLISRTWTALAAGKVRFVGEAVVAVVAKTADTARDAVEEVEVDYEPLPAVVDLERALLPDSPQVHEGVEHNIAIRFTQHYGDAEAELRAAPRRLRERFRITRGSGQPIEPRGVVARLDAETGQLVVWSSTQEPHTVRQTVANLLQVRPSAVRVIAPDTGGGFGTKLNAYPEEVLVPWLAQRLRQPVKWIESRSEHMLAAMHERDQVHDVDVGFNDNGRILAFKDVFLHDTGAYTPRGGAAPLITSSAMVGPYELRSYYSEFRAVYTNTSAVGVYRGAGQPQAVFVMERVMDRIAQTLGLDPALVRKRNMIRADAFPYDTKLKSFIGTPVLYDSGDFEGMLEKALAAAEYDRLRTEQEQARARGRLVGIGIACYVELTGRGPWEGASVRVEPDGSVTVLTGAPSQGQGHATTLAQICADELGVPFDAVHVLAGDTSVIPHGIGTFASRAGVMAGNAVKQAALEVKRKVLKLASEHLETAAVDLTIEDGVVSVAGVPELSVALPEISRKAVQHISAGETAPGLEATHYFQVQQMTYGSGAHVAAVEVDAETGGVKILKYVVGHDCGRVINPMIVEGQIHGGVACGIGNAMLERHVYDEDGQLLTGTFMDYAMPRAADVPPLIIVHQETPSTVNPLGVKGAGEAGAIPVPAAICAAVEDALVPLRIKLAQAPILQQELWRLIQQSKPAASA